MPAESSEEFATESNERVPSKSRKQVPYQDSSDRSKRAFRAEPTDAILTLVRQMSHEDSDIDSIMCDLTETKRWKDMCGKRQAVPVTVEQDHFLKKLAQEYEMCKNKEKNKQIRQQAAKLSKKINIGGTLKESKISLDGSSSVGQTRVEAAKTIGRVRAYSDEKRRLLSIVACEYPYRVLKQYFQCSNNTIVAARVHCLLFGRGGVPCDNLTFSRVVVSSDVINGLLDFLHRDDISRPSSCRSVVIDGQETGVRYWQDSIQNIVQQYLLEFPNGVKRTYIYTHLPKNFRMNTMLAGLCNICYDDGYANFENLTSLVNDLVRETETKEPLKNVLKKLEFHQRYLRTEFAKQVQFSSKRI